MNKEKALDFAQKFGVILAGFEDDIDVVRSAVKVNGEAIESASDNLKKSLEIIKIASYDKQYGLFNKFLDKLISDNPELKKDDDFMREIIVYNPYLISVSSDNLKNDPDLPEYCIKYSSDLINEISDEQKKNPYLWQTASLDDKFDLASFIEKLIHKGEFYTKDDNFMRNAILVDVSFIEYASDEVKDDKEVALECVKVLPVLIECLSDRLKADEEVAACALSHAFNGDAYFIFNNLSKDLKKNVSLWQIAAKDKDFDLFEYMGILVKEDPTLLNNVEFMKEATKHNQELLIDASDTVKDNEEIIIPCVNKCGFLLNYASKRLKNNLDVIKSAINGYRGDFERGDYELKDNVIAKMYKNYTDNIKNDIDVAMFAVVSDSNNISYVSDELKNKTDIVKYGAISAINEYFTKAGNPKDKYVSEIINSIASIVKVNNSPSVVQEEEKVNPKFKNRFNDEFTDEQREKIYEDLNEQFSVLDEYSNNNSLLR